MKNSPNTAISFPITGIPKGWEERGEMTIQTIFKQHTGGATEKKDQPEWMTDGPSVVRAENLAYFVTPTVPCVPGVCEIFSPEHPSRSRIIKNAMIHSTIECLLDEIDDDG
jgi:hypothetical protein